MDPTLGETCYLIVPDLVQYSQATSQCSNHGAGLVVIDTADENTFIFNKLSSLNVDAGVAHKSFWLGTDSNAFPQGVYKFVDLANGGYSDSHTWDSSTGSAVGYWSKSLISVQVNGR